MPDSSMQASRRWWLTTCLVLVLAVPATALLLGDEIHDAVLALLDLVERGKRDYLAAMVAAYVLAFAVLATLTLPVGTLFCLAAGYLFGIGLGFAAAMAGALLSGSLTFILVRRFGGRSVRRHIAASRFDPSIRALERDATWYLVFLRIVPVAPYFVINAAAAFTAIRFGHFILATAAGLVPTTLVYAGLGAGLGSLLEARELLGPALLLQPRFGLPLLGLLVILVISWLIHRRINHAHRA